MAPPAKHVPKFGQWDPNDHLAYSLVFDRARFDHNGLPLNPKGGEQQQRRSNGGARTAKGRSPLVKPLAGSLVSSTSRVLAATGAPGPPFPADSGGGASCNDKEAVMAAAMPANPRAANGGGGAPRLTRVTSCNYPQQQRGGSPSSSNGSSVSSGSEDGRRAAPRTVDELWARSMEESRLRLQGQLSLPHVAAAVAGGGGDGNGNVVDNSGSDKEVEKRVVHLDLSPPSSRDDGSGSPVAAALAARRLHRTMSSSGPLPPAQGRMPPRLQRKPSKQRFSASGGGGTANAPNCVADAKVVAPPAPWPKPKAAAVGPDSGDEDDRQERTLRRLHTMHVLGSGTGSWLEQPAAARRDDDGADQQRQHERRAPRRSVSGQEPQRRAGVNGRAALTRKASQREQPLAPPEDKTLDIKVAVVDLAALRDYATKAGHLPVPLPPRPVQKEAGLPAFGQWDDNPSEADSYTAAFSTYRKGASQSLPVFLGESRSLSTNPMADKPRKQPARSSAGCFACFSASAEE
eukprot:SM000112S24000  [mRNA]  locus=s112:323413:325853:+ [translate_table: standard]